MRPENIETLKESSGSNFSDMTCGHIFLHMFPKARETKPKINYWDCIKIKSSAQQRKQFTKLKDNLLEWGKIFANDISNKGLVSKMY